jgi:hypothetical protein
MTDNHQQTFIPVENGAVHETTEPRPETVPPVADVAGDEHAAQAPDAETGRWHAEAGRKGAHRLHQLIQEGKLYEQEHGLKRGRQRRRQLIELGKLYEQEHGLRPDGNTQRAKHLSRLERDEVLATLLRCLLRIAKPSFRAELVRLIEALQQADQAAQNPIYGGEASP